MTEIVKVEGNHNLRYNSSYWPKVVTQFRWVSPILRPILLIADIRQLS